MNEKNHKKLKALRLPAMAEEYLRQEHVDDIDAYAFNQRLSLMIDSETDSQHNNKIKRLIRNGNFYEASVLLSQIRYYEDRHLDKSLITELSANGYINKNRNIVIKRAAGSKKSYIANALAVNACHATISAKYVRLPYLLNELSLSRIQQNYRNVIKRYQKCPLLIIDEWLLVPTTDNEQRDLLEIIERRYRSGSTILCSQFSQESWHTKLGGGAIADAILDRLLSSSVSIIINGKVSRKSRKMNN